MTVTSHELLVAAVRRETADCSSFELDVPDALVEVFQHEAGQRVLVEILLEVWRPPATQAPTSTPRTC